MMEIEKDLKKSKRLDEIENRKIEILIEIAKINKNYNERVSILSSEYEKLDKEYYQLKLLVVNKDGKQNESHCL